MKCGKCNNIIPDGSSFCPICGGILNSKEESIAKKQTTYNKKVIALSILLGVVCVLLIALFISYTNNEIQYKAQYKELSDEREKAIEELKTVKVSAKKYADIVDYLTINSNPYFSASEYIFELPLNSKRDFNILTQFSEPFSVSFETHGDSASIEFLEEEWNLIANVRIRAIKEGITWFRFTNDVDSKEFCVIVIVS